MMVFINQAFWKMHLRRITNQQQCHHVHFHLSFITPSFDLVITLMKQPSLNWFLDQNLYVVLCHIGCNKDFGPYVVLKSD